MAQAVLGFSLAEIYDPFSRGRKRMKDYSKDKRESERVCQHVQYIWIVQMWLDASSSRFIRLSAFSAGYKILFGSSPYDLTS